MATLRVLHLASFVGNIGDNAMHDGACRTRADDLPFEIAYERLEIREFIHWTTRRLDDAFLSYANGFDAVIVGGDSLLQTWRDDTPTGTYLDCAPDFLAGVRRPICFYGLGVDATRGVSETAMTRCRSFLDGLLADRRRLLSVRDDGSIDLVRAHLGPAYADAMAVIPDGGLFARPEPCPHPERPAGTERLLAVNLAGDMPDKRFAGAGGGDRDAFCRAMAGMLSGVLARDPGLGLVFVPHIHSDVAIVADTLAALDDRQRRTRVGIAPYVQGDHWSAGFDLYREADLVLAMRFHANLVPIGLGVPAIGLDTHHKIGGAFAALGLADRCVSGDARGLVEAAGAIAARDLSDGTQTVRQRQQTAVAAKRATLKAFHEAMANWLERTL
ncbi:polysaccharide pyruvyl transferase family protein [Polymorphum gilvum]|uniref:Polysaccharide pyruvyl transferase domain-containing protein n=1 Tax=Polymorphum gilvum (strain LMG 25793 / CGMCC 1.9160 / SL003B-26A1) TaxID=991905 RepID=F2J5C7_POLGS|nr:polysaccharide pyruvyl transferase family protein [Polymorphum gilvum]ADZ71186.1 hypothetical protein SL003B_2763 [Polymorphum gilvum SL003B-26A1]